MKHYDLMIVGPATRDVNIDYTGAEDRSVGGAVTFCTPAARAAGCADVRWFADRESAQAALAEAFGPGDCALLKASHFSGRFDLTADYLRTRFT